MAKKKKPQQTKKCVNCNAEFAAAATVVHAPNCRRVVSQRVCSKCGKGRHRWVKRCAHARERRARAAAPRRSTSDTAEEQAARQFGRSRPEIARELGITEREAALAEQSLLRKLRGDRALRAAFAEFTSEGCPLLVQLIRELRPPQKEINLLNLQAELIEWWGVLALARKAGLTDADGLGEAEASVAKSHALLAEKIRKGKL